MTIKTRLTAVRKWIAGVVLSIAAALGIYVNAQAPVYQVSLTLPSQYTDNSALPLSALTSYTVAYKAAGASTYTTKVVNGPFTQANQSTTIPKELGQTCINAFVNVGAVASAATSPDVCPTFTGPPKAPTNLTVQ
jgi:hypothetical protein